MSASAEPSPPSRGDGETGAGSPGDAAAARDLGLVWAAAAAPGRRVLIVGTGGRSGSELIEQAGAVSVQAVDEAARCSERFDLVIRFEGLESASDLDAALSSLETRLAEDGLVLASVSARAPAAQRAALRDALSRRFGHVAAFGAQTLRVNAVVPERSNATIALRVPRETADGPSTLFAASHRPIPELPPVAVPALSPPSHDPAESAAAWEERARGAEAEAAVTRWELYIVREAWRAVLARLAELESRPLDRLSRRVRRVPLRRPPR